MDSAAPAHLPGHPRTTGIPPPDYRDPPPRATGGRTPGLQVPPPAYRYPPELLRDSEYILQKVVWLMACFSRGVEWEGQRLAANVRNSGLPIHSARAQGPLVISHAEIPYASSGVGGLF